ncbi:MAG: rane protein-like protein [Betaproteobacteria bacterium]|nr:rane protein-like protein [Betaproteobacteria bacterium]
MWLLGGLLGLFIGAGINSYTGAAIGVALGVVGGFVLRKLVEDQVARRVAQSEGRIEHIYQSLSDIHFRLKALEDARSQAALVRAKIDGRAPAAAADAPPATVAAAVPSSNVAPAEAPVMNLESAAAVARQPASRDLPIQAPPVEDLALLPIFATPVETAAPTAPTAPTAPMALEPVTTTPAAVPLPRAESGQQTPPLIPKAAVKPAPPAPRETAEPGFMARLFAGNVVAKAGVVILFFGVGFLLKYAYDHSILPPWTRLLGVAVASAGLFYAGLRLIAARRLYALILMGAAFGFLYLDVFFALKSYHYIDATAGFALFMALGVVMVLTAVRMDARPLAVLGLFGAFLAPPLASTGGGSYVLLFSYYTLLNLFILTVSWFKAWRDLNLVGFGFTFVISALWGAHNYEPEMFASIEPFVIGFFLIYLAIPVLFATRQEPRLKGLVDGTLVFGTPLAAAFMQARVVEHMGDHALAWSAAAAGILYAVLGWATRRREYMQMLGETYLALATVLGTMTVFFALDAYPTFALWTLEGAAIVWVGLRQQRPLARAFGLLLQVGAALYFLAHYNEVARANPVFNDFVLGCALIAVAAWITARLMDKYRERISDGETLAGAALLCWGFAWWFGGGLHALHHAVPPEDFAPAGLLLASATLLVAEFVGAWLPPAGWPALRRIASVHLGFVITAMGWSAIDFWHPLAGLGCVAWPAGFITHFWILRRQRSDGLEAALEFREILGWAAAAVLATWDAAWLILHDRFMEGLLWAGAGFVSGWLRHYLGEAEDETSAKPIARLVLLWSLVMWGTAGLGWLDQLYSGTDLFFYALACAAGSALLFEVAGSLGRWADLRRTALLLPVCMLAVTVRLAEQHLHPIADQGVWAWPLAFALAWSALWRQERDECALLPKAQHLVLFWLLALLLVWEVDARLHLAEAALQWQRAAWGAIPAAMLIVTVALGARGRWPFRDHALLYRDLGLAPLLIVMAAWSLYANLADPGVAVPATHIPLLNPLDLAQMLVLYAAWFWARDAADDLELSHLVKPVFAALAFVWVNGVALRAIHYYADVPYELQAQLASVLTQSVLSLLWTGCALVLMTWASRRSVRTPWTVGAVLLGVVVLKLVVNDLGNSGTVARIVSFLGVGVMLLLIGYMAPLPPGQPEQEGDGRG